MSAAETELERQLSTVIMHGGARPRIRKIPPGTRLTEQGTPGDDVCLVLEGVSGDVRAVENLQRDAWGTPLLLCRTSWAIVDRATTAPEWQTR